jgi:hypothetical protein
MVAVMAANVENNPMYSTGIAHMNEERFLRVALRAKRLLVARASREGQKVSLDELESEG